MVRNGGKVQEVRMTRLGSTRNGKCVVFSACPGLRCLTDWQARREVEGSKLRAELDKKLNKFEGYADRLERRAGPRFCPGADGTYILYP